MRILLTNDDGIYAPGLQALAAALAAHHRVEIIAPDRERSAVGHAITLHEPLRIHSVALNAHYRGLAVNGTPADCVKLGICEVLPERPELVVAGINPGANVGVNINYSGTVAAAREAALFGLPAIAASVEGRAVVNYDEAAAFVARLAERVRRRGLPRGTFINVNFPNRPLREIRGVRISRQGCGEFPDRFEKRQDPRNRVYYWQGGDRQIFEADPDIDGAALAQDFIAITPVKCDMTDYAALAEMQNWDWHAGD
jgi:5'-nucleotidase